MSEKDFLWALVLMGGMVVVILAAVAFSRRRAHPRRAQSQERFGSAYDRAAYELGGSRKAEQEPRGEQLARERQHSVAGV